MRPSPGFSPGREDSASTHSMTSRQPHSRSLGRSSHSRVTPGRHEWYPAGQGSLSDCNSKFSQPAPRVLVTRVPRLRKPSPQLCHLLIHAQRLLGSRRRWDHGGGTTRHLVVHRTVDLGGLGRRLPRGPSGGKDSPGFVNLAPCPIRRRKRRHESLHRGCSRHDLGKYADEKPDRGSICQVMSQSPGTPPNLVLGCPGKGLQRVFERALGRVRQSGGHDPLGPCGGHRGRGRGGDQPRRWGGGGLRVG
jgi:hypothetical protein